MTQSTSRTDTRPALLLIGASRGLGLAMAAEFVARGWAVLGTVRGDRTGLHDLAAAHPGRVEVERLDITDERGLAALSSRLEERRFDMLFVNAGTTNPQPMQPIAEVPTEEFTELMITNALSPMRVIAALDALVTAEGLIGVMSSGQGSIANNERGLREAYRGSKATLNMFMRSYAARTAEGRPAPRPMATMAPGWVKTDLGGAEAPLTIEDSVPGLVEVLLAKRARPGLEYLDYRGRTVPW